jgi:DNA-binding NarL/FixJ family response regulator
LQKAAEASNRMENRLQETDGEPIDKRLPVTPIAASAGSDGGDGKGRPPLGLMPAPAKEPLPLTRREKECLRLAAHGMMSRDIGQLLKISERTCICHLQNATHKLGVHNLQTAIKKTGTPTS